MGVKVCSKCHKKKSLRLFYRDIQKIDGFTSACRDCIRETRIVSYEKRRNKALEFSKEYYNKNREQIKGRLRQKRKEIIEKIFGLLGNKCNVCGFNDKIALQIDHKNGGGYRHRKIKGGGMSYYRDILENIKDYQLLCANCNFIEGVKKGYRKSIWS